MKALRFHDFLKQTYFNLEVLDVLVPGDGGRPAGTFITRRQHAAASWSRIPGPPNRSENTVLGHEAKILTVYLGAPVME